MLDLQSILSLLAQTLGKYLHLYQNHAHLPLDLMQNDCKPATSYSQFGKVPELYLLDSALFTHNTVKFQLLICLF